MEARNAALLAKLCWRIASSQNYPWAQMLISKYLTTTRLSEGGRKLPASKIWAACKEGGIISNKGLKWAIANGEEVGLWDDFCLPSGPLGKQIEGPLAEGENNMSVQMFLSNPNEISFNFPETIKNDIQVSRNSIPTREVLGSRGFNLCLTCEVCGISDESIAHALCDCPRAKRVWTKLGISSTNQEFYNLPIPEWLKSNCSSAQVIFYDGSFNPKFAGHCLKKGVEFFAIVPENPNKLRRVLARVCWTKPQEGWVKLNSDGSVLGNSKKAGGGAVLRCSNGNWVTGCLRKLGNTSCVLGELWALRDGLLLAKQLCLENICVDINAKFLIYLLSNTNVVYLSLEPLLSDCRNLMKTFLNCAVVHVYREANRCADRLARLGADLHSDHLILYNPPPVVEDLLASDKAGFFGNRLVVP
ncbi:hypothetical protein SO802_001953 [Lithocarpus litseifolius]|uniref:RNase H type-1 domain-containing protein n=1 Tax=Lithocarpus litseifolius TaxID=425828 RepID=A0AAW2DXK4_9ROSI